MKSLACEAIPRRLSPPPPSERKRGRKREKKREKRFWNEI